MPGNAEELERLFVALVADDSDLQRTFERIVTQAQGVAKNVSTAFQAGTSKAFVDAGAKVEASATRQTKAVDKTQAAFEALRNESASLRNTVEAGLTPQDKAIERFLELQNAALNAAAGFDVTSKEYRQYTQVAAQASRSVATLEGRATKLGFSANAAVGITAALRNNIGALGPAGDAAGRGLGIMQLAFSGFQRTGPGVVGILGAVTNGVKTLTLAMPFIAAGATVAAVAGLARLGNEAAKTANDIDKAAQSAGFSAEAFQEVAFALQQTGVGMDQTKQGLNDFNARLGQAAAGTVSIVGAYQNLGVAIRDANGNIRSSEDVFTDLIGALGRIPSAAEQAAAGGIVFGEEFSRKVIPALNLGADGFQALRDTARDLGLILSGDSIQSLVSYQEAMTTLSKQFETARIEIAAAFIPVLRDVLIPLMQNAVMPALQNVATRVGEFSQAFMDQGPAGQVFREDMVRNLEVVLQISRAIVVAATAAVGSVQTILGGAAVIGGFLGGVGAAGITRQAREGAEEIVRQLEARLAQGGLTPDSEARLRGLLADARADLAAMPQNFLEAGNQAGLNAGEAFAGGAVASFDLMMDALNADTSAMLERWSANVATAAGSGASTLRDLLDVDTSANVDLGVGGQTEALAGSLDALQRELGDARKAFNAAATEADRAAAQERIDIAQAEIDRITAIYKAADPFAPAKTWVARLAAEVDAGMKTGSDAFRIVQPRLEELRAESTNALKEFGFDSAEYRDAIGKLQVLQSFVDTLSGDPIKINVQVDAGTPVALKAPEVSVEVAARPTKEVTNLLIAAAADGKSAMIDYQTDYSNFVRDIEMGQQRVREAFRGQGDAALIFADSLRALHDSGASVAELEALLARSPLLSAGLLMGAPGPGPGESNTGSLAALYATAAKAHADFQTALTKDARDAAFAREEAARKAIEEVEHQYEAVSLTLKPGTFGDAGLAEIFASVKPDMDAAAKSAELFGTENQLASVNVNILTNAIQGLLDLDPAADVSSLYEEWVRQTAALKEANAAALEATKLQGDLANVQSQLLDLTGEAPSKWDAMRATIAAAGAAGLVTKDELEALLDTIDKFEGIDAQTKAVQDVTGGISIGTDIATGLTRGLTGIRDGDLQGALGGLTQVGSAIGTAIGGPAVGALVGAIGEGLQSLAGLAQVLSDLFTGDSPARRELAAGIASAVAGGFKQGILDGINGVEGWQDKLEEDTKTAVLGALVDAFIQAAVIQAIFQPFIDEFTKILQGQGIDAAFDYFDQNFEAVFDKALGVTEDFVDRARERFGDLGSDATAPDVTDWFSLPTATVSVIAAPQWASDLTAAASSITDAGAVLMDAATIIRDTFRSGINVTTSSGRGIDAQRTL